MARLFEFMMANRFRACHSEELKMSNFDCIILDFMQYNIERALQDITTLGFSWMTAYPTALLQKRNAIVADEQVLQADCNLQENLCR
jgi:hypothetical protein